jgi:hypothetical protein
MKPTVLNSKPAKIALLDLAVLCVAGIALRLLLSSSLRLHAANPSALLPLAASVLGAAVAAFVILAVFVRHLAAPARLDLLPRRRVSLPLPGQVRRQLLVISWSMGLAISARRYE